MSPTGIVVLLTLALIVVYVYSRDSIRAWRHYRGVRLVACPETGAMAAVEIDLAHAMTTAFIENAVDVRLKRCSRWAVRGVCREPCVPEVVAHGDGGRVQTIVDRWYLTQKCFHCGRRIAHATSVHHPPAFAEHDGATIEWTHLPPEQLPDMMATHRAVCWNCHIAETFRRTYPDLYVDRPQH